MPNHPSLTHNDYEVTKRDLLFKGNFLCLARYAIKRRLFSGNWSDAFNYEVLERKSAVAILPYDPVLDKVILIEQFRPGALADPQSPWLLEIPAGIINENEAPEQVAHRETIEEIGAEASVLRPICEFFVSPGGANEHLRLYCGKVDARTITGIHGLTEEHEDIRVINLSVEEALSALYAGHVKTAPALVALLWLQLHREQLKKEWLW